MIDVLSYGKNAKDAEKRAKKYLKFVPETKIKVHDVKYFRGTVIPHPDAVEYSTIFVNSDGSISNVKFPLRYNKQASLEEKQAYHNKLAKVGAVKKDKITGEIVPVSDFERGAHKVIADSIFKIRKRKGFKSSFKN